MYFRILVNQAGQKFFRTSRLHTPGKADLVRSLMVEAFPTDEGYSVEILKVTGEPVGEVISQQLLVDLCADEANAVADSDENAKFA